MNVVTASSSHHIAARPSGALPAIFAAGLLAGLLDITAAFVTWAPQGVPPVRILQGIASGLLGPQAFKEGMATALLGGTLHFLIALSAAAVFYAASRKIDFMTRRPILSGVLYGVCVYLVMYWIVMPLSRFYPAQTITRRASYAVLPKRLNVRCRTLPKVRFKKWLRVKNGSTGERRFSTRLRARTNRASFPKRANAASIVSSAFSRRPASA
jgi:hypothetical protein